MYMKTITTGLVALGLTAGVASAASVSLGTDADSVGVGNSIEVLISASDIPSTIGLEGFASYDSDFLSLTSVTYDSAFDVTPLDFGDDDGEILVLPGLASGDISGDFEVATLTFEAVAAGIASIALTDFLFLPPGETSGQSVTGDSITLSVTGGDVAVIPLPAGGMLLLTGLLGLAAARRKTSS